MSLARFTRADEVIEFFLLRCMSPEMALRVISRQRNSLVVSGAKRTSAVVSP